MESLSQSDYANDFGNDEKMGCCGRKITSVGAMAANFMLSASNAIRHALKTKKIMAPNQIINSRVATCKACEFMSSSRCNACGCYIVVKAALDSEKCPKGKW